MTQKATESKIGDRMDDGTVCAGFSPDTGKAMYAMPGDAPLTYTFNQAQKYAAKLEAHGHQDWRVPTLGELNVLYNNRAAIGGFEIAPRISTRWSDDTTSSGPNPANWYWSSLKVQHGFPWARNIGVWAQNFEPGGFAYEHSEGTVLSLRCVR